MFKGFSTLSSNIEYSIEQDKTIDIDIRYRHWQTVFV